MSTSHTLSLPSHCLRVTLMFVAQWRVPAGGAAVDHTFAPVSADSKFHSKANGWRWRVTCPNCRAVAAY
jgi:hypothetical protein